MNQAIADKLSIARARLLLDHPFFGVLSLRLQLIEDSSIKTMATNGSYIKYSPEFAESLSIEHCSGVVAHEVMHCVMEHCLRRGDRDPKKWNIAADYVINPIILDAGIQLPEGHLFDQSYVGMSVEQVYALLPDQPEQEELCDVQSADAADAQDQEVDWKLATVQAAKAEAMRGNLPACLKKLLDDVLTPAIPWRDVLAQFMTERVRDDYSFRRPNPFYMESGFYLPTMDGLGMGEVVIALDTSGSVASVLDEFGSTVKDIIAGCAPSRVHVIYCDADVNHVQTFERGNELTFEAVGGGGTDFRPVFDYVKNNSIRPACLLYLTDMYGAFPEEAPEYPVMWCATSGVVGPFGETLQIRADR